METFEAARKEGKVRYIGFSAHSVETAVAAMGGHPFDTVLFPINWGTGVAGKLWSPGDPEGAGKGNWHVGHQEHGQDSLAGEQKRKYHPHSKCWYEPAEFPKEASLGLRWTLGHGITAAIPPGDEAYFRSAMDVAQRYSPLDSKEEQVLLNQASNVQPIYSSWKRCLIRARQMDLKPYMELAQKQSHLEHRLRELGSVLPLPIPGGIDSAYLDTRRIAFLGMTCLLCLPVLLRVRRERIFETH